MAEDDNIVLEYVVEILLLITFCGLIILGVSMMTSSQTPKKTAIVEGFSTMVHTLVGQPGDGLVAYPSDVSEYVFILSDQKISVYHKDEHEREAFSRPIFLPDGYSAASQGVVKDTKSVCLERKDRTITLKGCSS